jgi:hypothetical protein
MTREEFDDYLISIDGLTSNYSGRKITTCGFFEVGVGWYELIKNLIIELISVGWDKNVYQVKEKFAELRFYTNTNAEMDNIISKYAKLSTITCEKCGESGEIISVNNWLKCTCENCK